MYPSPDLFRIESHAFELIGVVRAPFPINRDGTAGQVRNYLCSVQPANFARLERDVPRRDLSVYQSYCEGGKD
jgi:hypothetical protein